MSNRTLSLSYHFIYLMSFHMRGPDMGQNHATCVSLTERPLIGLPLNEETRSKNIVFIYVLIILIHLHSYVHMKKKKHAKRCIEDHKLTL